MLDYLDLPQDPDLAASARSTAKTLSQVITNLKPERSADWGWANYKLVIRILAQEFKLARLCEIGGGRRPLFTGADIAKMGCTVTINDISQSELNHGPDGYDTLCFDIAGDIGKVAPERFDLMFSRMVFEHVQDMKQAWRNVHTLLAPGGVALAFVPTLYALPFVINKILPEHVTGPLVRSIYPHRSDNGQVPKFPAYYHGCFGNDRKLKPTLEAVGFCEHLVVPFWGHDYFRHIPVLREIDSAFNKLAARQRWLHFTTYSYVIVRKQIAD